MCFCYQMTLITIFVNVSWHNYVDLFLFVLILVWYCISNYNFICFELLNAFHSVHLNMYMYGVRVCVCGLADLCMYVCVTPAHKCVCHAMESCGWSSVSFSNLSHLLCWGRISGWSLSFLVYLGKLLWEFLSLFPTSSSYKLTMRLDSISWVNLEHLELWSLCLLENTFLDDQFAQFLSTFPSSGLFSEMEYDFWYWIL